MDYPKAGNQLIRWLRLIDVELITILYSFAHEITGKFIPMLIETKVIQELQDNSIPTPSHGSMNVTNHWITTTPATNTSHYLWQADDMKLTNRLLAFIPGLLVTLILAPLSDLYGRQLSIVVPLLGRLVSVCCYTIESWSLASSRSVMLSALPDGLTGSHTLLMAGLVSRIRDSAGDDRKLFTIRVGRFLGLKVLSSKLGIVTGTLLLAGSGQGAYITGLVLTAVAPPVAMLALAGEKGAAGAEEYRVGRVVAAPGRALMRVLGRKWGGWYLLATTLFYISYSGQHLSTQFLNIINGVLLYWCGMSTPFSWIMQDVLSIVGFLLVVPVIVSCMDNISGEVLAIVGNLAMIGMSIGTVLDYSGSYVAAFGVSTFMLAACLAFVSNITCLSSAVTSKEIGTAMAAFTVLMEVAQIAGRALATGLAVTFLTFWDAGFICSTILFSLVSVIYGAIRHRRDRTNASGQVT